MPSHQWMVRYRAGEHSAVWHELRQLGAAVHQDSAIAREAQEVCDEMATRARANVETIVRRLQEAGFMTLRSWLTIVGDVWLVGTHPVWAASRKADPLVIEAEASRYPLSSVVDYYAEEPDAWQFSTDVVRSRPL